MSAADEAYKAAVREIERVRKEGGARLVLNGDKFRALERLPMEVASLYGLNTLDLSFTKIVNISALTTLRRVQHIDLSGTNITNLDALSGLTDLLVVDLIDTQIVDVSALAGLFKLQSLDLFGTRVRDLRPICYLPLNYRGQNVGLRFNNTPAVKLDDRLRDLLDTKSGEDLIISTLGYLRSLPKYPEPLPWIVNLEPNATNYAKDDDTKVQATQKTAPALLKPLSLKDARHILEKNYPMVRDRCQIVVAELDDALAMQTFRIPNDPAAKADHDSVSQSLILAKAAMIGIYEALPDGFIDQPLDKEAINKFKKAFNDAIEQLQQAAAYIDHSEHTPTYGGLLKLGAATAVGSVLALVPGVGMAVAIPAVYAMLYGKEAAKGLAEIASKQLPPS